MSQSPKNVDRSWVHEDHMGRLAALYRKEGIEEAWASEETSIRSELVAIDRLIGHRYKFGEFVGVGGTAIVARLDDLNLEGTQRALKFPRPSAGRIDLISELIKKEINLLASLKHPNIVRIVDSGVAGPLDGAVIPYYIMDFVAGVSSKRWLQQEASSGEAVVRLIASATRVISYLHQEPSPKFAHLDIKPENFVVDDLGNPILIDLGTCKHLSGEEVLTTIACTRRLAAPGLLQHLDKDPTDENRSRGQLQRAEIDPAWDLWSFGLTILLWLGFDLEDGKLINRNVYDRLSGYQRKYLLLLASRLLIGGPGWLNQAVGLSADFLQEFKISRAQEMSDLLERLVTGSAFLDSIPEFSSSFNTIQAAPGRHVAATKSLLTVLQHRLFRRLNGISQLGLVSQVYPGATHTRREHSLGTYANTIEFVRRLFEDPASPLFRQIVNAEDVRDVLLCALLHDLGQFPLAHDLEEIDDKIFDHGELTSAMLRGVWDRRRRGYRRLDFASLDAVFKEWKTTADRVLAILDAKPGSASAHPKQKLLRSIISGPIDADKLDYLARDARHLDLPYPNGVDVERLLTSITTVVVDGAGGKANVPCIGVHSKSKVAAEFLCIARYAMFSQAYWHHAVRAQKAMLFRAVEALLANLKEEATAELHTQFLRFVSDLPESLQGGSDGEQLLIEGKPAPQEVRNWAGRGSELGATDAAVLVWFLERLAERKLPEAELIDRILRRELFKRLWVVGPDMGKRKVWESLAGDWQKLDRAGRNNVALEFEKSMRDCVIKEKQRGITEMPASTARDWMDRRTAGRSPWLLVDIPGSRPGSDIGLFVVLEGQRRRLRRDLRAVGDLEPSETWERYSGNLLQAAGKIRIFGHPEIVDFLEESVEWSMATQILQAKIKEAGT